MLTESQWATCKGTWGDAELKQLINHFGVPQVSAGPLGKTHSRVVDPTLARAQWESFEHELYTLKRRGLSLEDGYIEILRSDLLPDIKRLACIFLVLCLSTVWCERGFSLMALIKTCLRNCMNMETLGALMMVKSNCPELSDKEGVTEIIDKAFELWMKKQKRCMARSHPSVKKQRANKR